MVKSNILSRAKGFTLIELLVVTTIIIVFTGLSFATYNQFFSTTQFDQEVNKVMNKLEEMRGYAINGYNVYNLCNMTNLSGYSLDQLCTYKFDLSFHCLSNGGADQSQIYSGYDFHPTSVSMTNSLNNDFGVCFSSTVAIKFKALTGVVETKVGNNPPVSQNVDLILYDSAPTPWTCLRITIFANGVIKKGTKYNDDGSHKCP